MSDDDDLYLLTISHRYAVSQTELEKELVLDALQLHGDAVVVGGWYSWEQEKIAEVLRVTLVIEQ